MGTPMRYQPQGLARISPTNPIARGLVLAFQGGSAGREVVSGATMTGRGSAQAVSLLPGGKAFDLRAVNTAAFFSAQAAAAQLSSDQTVLFDLVINGAPAGSGPSLGGMWMSTAQNDAWLSVDRPSTDELVVNFRIAGTSSTRLFNIAASTRYGQRLTIAASVTRVTPGGGTVYLRVAANGTMLYDLSSAYSGAGSNLITPTGTEYISIGSESIENASRNCNALQYGQYHLGRVISAADVAAFSANPWAIIDAGSGSSAYQAAIASGAGAQTRSSVNGAENSTLANVSLASSGASTVTGSTTVNLAALTARSTGSATAAGALAVMLATTTLNAAGVVSADGSLLATLDGSTTSSSGQSGDVGTFANALGLAVLASTGSASAEAESTLALAPAALASSATAAASGVAATPLSSATLSATSAATVRGYAIAALGQATLAASATVAGNGDNPQASQATPAHGVLVEPLQVATLSACGGVLATGRASSALDTLALSASGTAPAGGQLARTLDAMRAVVYVGLPIEGGQSTLLGDAVLVAHAGMFVFTPSPARTYVIQPEDRRYRVAPESRTYRIEP